MARKSKGKGAAAVMRGHLSRQGTSAGSRRPRSKTIRSEAQANVRLGGHAGGNFDNGVGGTINR